MGIRERRFCHRRSDHHIIEFWRVPYDIASVQKRMEKAGLPYQLVERLGVAAKDLCDKLISNGSCSARLQASNRRFKHMPPEGGRYIKQKPSYPQL